MLLGNVKCGSVTKVVGCEERSISVLANERHCMEISVGSDKLSIEIID
jgi:hypothetical protein